MPRFAVLRTEWEPLEAAALAPILERALGLVRLDALRQAGAARGILAERLPRDRADALVAGCSAAGIGTRVVAQERLPVVGVPTLVRTLTIGRDALVVTFGYTGPRRPLAWEAVRLLSAGAVVERREVMRGVAPTARKRAPLLRTLALHALAGPVLGSLIARAAESRVAQGRQAARPAPAAARVVEVADLFVAEPGGAMLHLRLRAPDLYYAEILGAEDPHDPALGFRLVLARLAERATAGIASPTLAAMLAAPGPDGGVPAEAQFADVHELGQYHAWLLQTLAAEA